MKASELRIGNWINTGEFHLKEYQGEHQMEHDWFGYTHMFKPIPLTEEWLLKFGFDKVKSNYVEAETWDFYFDILYFDMANNSVKINGQYCLSNIPEHVHQLQNLYFALTGEELTINQNQLENGKQ